MGLFTEMHQPKTKHTKNMSAQYSQHHAEKQTQEKVNTVKVKITAMKEKRKSSNNGENLL